RAGRVCGWRKAATERIKSAAPQTAAFRRRGVGGTSRGPLVVVLILALLAPTAALAHVERTSYWPDPRPDTSVTPPAGGEVPKARSLASALDRRAASATRVVCRPGSPGAARADIAAARTRGHQLRPT